MKRTLKVTLSLVVITIVLSSLTFARFGGRRGPGRRGFGLAELPNEAVKMLLEKAKIPEAKINKILKLKYQIQKEKTQLEADLKIKHIDFKEEMDKDNPNEKKLMKLIDDAADIEKQLKKKRASFMLEMKTLLTKDEQKAIRDSIMEIKEKRDHKRNRRSRKRQRKHHEGGCDNMDNDF